VPGIWSRIFRTFRRPWKIKHRKDGGFWIEAANGRVLLYVYPRRDNNPEFRKPDDEEALDIVRAIARLSKRRRRPMPHPWVPLAKRRRWRQRR
jgi:hypothetical protein